MRRTILAACALAATACCEAASLSADAFSQWPAMTQVRIAPDGSHLLYVGAAGDRQAVAVLETAHPSATARVVMTSHPLSEIVWCGWANAKRILCATRHDSLGSSSENPTGIYRLLAVDRDGANAVSLWEKASRAEFEALLVSLQSADGKTILIERSNGLTDQSSRASRPVPQVVRLDVNTANREVVASANSAFLHDVRFWSDPSGEVMMASGFNGKEVVFWARLQPDDDWRPFLRYLPLQSAGNPVPFALVPGEKSAYAIGRGARHQALLQTDFVGERAVRVLYEGDADVERPLMSGSRELIAMELDTDRPSAHYFNKRDAGVVASADQWLPGRVNTIVDVSPDRRIYVVRSSSDTDAGTYYLLDARVAEPQFVLLGSMYPQLAIDQLPPTRVVRIQAGARSLRAFLTLPQAAAGTKSPLVLMPDAGPLGRPFWTFNFMRSFLVARGYAVLQLQLRDTESARQYLTVRHDLHRESYDAMIGAARWAIDDDTIDPQRIAVVGWGYGGYLAVLASQRDANLLKSVIAINAVTDLTEWPSIDLVVGNAPARLSRRSARGQAPKTGVPVLLIHGSLDSVVRPRHASRLMHAYHMFGVKYDELEIADGGYDLNAPAMRREMLNTVDDYLGAHLH
ncbi:MAG TPA: prolyl oligopeptidase family serine peptidase [Povalibacter sp.]|nr:prolyl oligopeptidase family serine peptidase [Povalibacter sp.]